MSRGTTNSLVHGNGGGTSINIDFTQLVLLIPATVVTSFVLPAAYLLEFKGFGALYETVPAGGTSNFYWAMIQYAPILITFAFSSSMVQTALVARTVWPDKKFDASNEAPSSVKDQNSIPSTPRVVTRGLTRKKSSGIFGLLSRRESSRDSTLRSNTEKLALQKFEESAELASRAKDMLNYPTKVELLQWFLLILYILLTLLAGVFANPTNPLWDRNDQGLAAVLGVASLFGVLIAAATVRNARKSLLVRAEADTPRRVASFLGRAVVTLLVQHLCFFLVAVAATNLPPAVQPIAFASKLGDPDSPCNLITEEYVWLHCNKTLDLFGAGPASMLKCDDGGYGAQYRSAFGACGSALSAIRMRTCAYGALALNVNALLYLLLTESTQGMDHLTLNKFVRGRAGQRTVLVGLFYLIALGCLPLFLVFMILSPMMAMKSDLSLLLNIVFFLNCSCWVMIGFLLNLEFLSTFMRYRTEFDVFISYRVQTEQRVAGMLYNLLTRHPHSLRVYLDKVCLEDGKPWQEGFTKGLFRSNVYCILFSKAGMERLLELTPDSPVDNVLLEIRLARELHARRGEDAFQVLPCFIGEHDTCAYDDVEGSREADKKGFNPFDCGVCKAAMRVPAGRRRLAVKWPTRLRPSSSSSAATADASSSSGGGVIVQKVEDRLGEIVKVLGMGHRPRTNASVHDNIKWLLEIQGPVLESECTVQQVPYRRRPHTLFPPAYLCSLPACLALLLHRRSRRSPLE